MKKFIFLLLPFLVSCKCLPEVIHTVHTDTKVEYRDTTIYVTLPGDTVHQTDSILVYKDPVTGGLTSAPSFLRTKIARSYAQIVNGLLRHELIQEDLELELFIKDAIQKHSTHTIETKVIKEEVNRLKWWQTALIYLGTVTLITCLIGGVWLVMRKGL